MTKGTINQSKDKRQIEKKICNTYRREELASMICTKLFEINEIKINNPIAQPVNNTNVQRKRKWFLRERCSTPSTENVTYKYDAIPFFKSISFTKSQDFYVMLVLFIHK